MCCYYSPGKVATTNLSFPPPTERVQPSYLTRLNKRRRRGKEKRETFNSAFLPANISARESSRVCSRVQLYTPKRRYHQHTHTERERDEQLQEEEEEEEEAKCKKDRSIMLSVARTVPTLYTERSQMFFFFQFKN